MRWRKLGIFIGVPVLVSVIILIFIDSWIERGLEKSGEKIVGAKVEMEGFHFSLLNGSTEWKRLQVTDPKNTMKNLFETGTVQFQLNPSALLRKRFIIEEMSVLNIATGTQRVYDGSLPKRKRHFIKNRKPTLFSKMKAKMTEEIESMPVLEWKGMAPVRLNAASLVAAADLQIIHHADSANLRIQQITRKWKIFSETFRPDEDLKRLGKTFRSIEIKEVNTLPELISLLRTIQTSEAELKAIRDTIQIKSVDMRSDLNSLNDIRKNLSLWVESDYQNLLAKAKLPDLSTKNIGKILFGPEIVGRVGSFLDLMDLVRRILPRQKPSQNEKKEPKQKGQTLHYADHHGRPTFLIRHMALSGHVPSGADSDALFLEGEGAGITTQPWVYQKPTTLHLQGNDKSGRSVKLAAILNWMENQSWDSLSIQLNKLPIHIKKPDSSKALVPAIKQGFADVKIQTFVEEARARIHADVLAKQLIYDLSSLPRNPFGYRLRSILSDNPSLTFGVDIEIVNEQVTTHFRSSLDEIVSREFKRLLSESTLKMQNQIRSLLNLRTKNKRNSMEANLADSQNGIQIIQANYQNQLDDVLSIFNAKKEALTTEIEKREKKEKDKLEGKAKDLLDQLFKKKKKKKDRSTNSD